MKLSGTARWKENNGGSSRGLKEREGVNSRGRFFRKLQLGVRATFTRGRVTAASRKQGGEGEGRATRGPVLRC